MSLLIDYLDWRGDLTIDMVPENEIDAVFMTQLVMLPIRKIVENKITIGELAKKYFENDLDEIELGPVSPSLLNEMVEKIQNQPRYKNFVISNYLFLTDDEQQMQMTAMTIDSPKTRYVVFAGTGDALISWRECFNLIYKTPTPSQLNSIKYLESAAEKCRKRLIVCGHSKGGHLAMYSSLHASKRIQDKIYKIYNIDGPGLTEAEWKKLPRKEVCKKILALFPQCSIVGRLFEHREKTDIVKCDSVGLFQHDCFYWYVNRHEFVKVDKFDEESNNIDKLVDDILLTLSESDREEFVEALYRFLVGTESTTLSEVMLHKNNLILSYTKLSPAAKKSLVSIGVKLWRDPDTRKLVSKNIVFYLKERKKQK